MRKRRAKRLGSRLSVSLTTDQKDAIEDLASRTGVPLAWVMRRAVERLLENPDDLGLPTTGKGD